MKTLVTLALTAGLATTALAQPPASMTKDQIHAELLRLAQSTAPADVARYEQLSAFTGGDRPGPSGGAVATVTRGLPVNPPNCAQTSFSNVNNTPVPINDVATNNSSLSIAGANPFLFQVTVTANLSHTFAADMDITLISPAGTRVTLSTDNGAGNDNVFAGTTWSDQASTTTTDAVYANLVVQPLLIPEEAMGAFFGENPNGTWTLEVVDDLAGDTGTINSWSLAGSALATAPILTNTSVSNNTPVPINDVSTATSSVSVSGADTYLCQASVFANVTHTFSSALDIRLISPVNSTALSTANGGGNDDVFAGTTWVDTAGTPTTDFVYANLVVATPLVPEGAMGAFTGIDPNGTWTFEVVNRLAGDTGLINHWTLDLTTCACAASDADLALIKTVAPAAVPPGGNAVFTLTATNNGSGDSTNTVVTDTLPAGLAYVSNDCGGSFAVPTFTWNIGNLANGASVVCNVTVTVNASGTNAASITSDQNDTVPANNVDAVSVGVLQNALEIPTVGLTGLMALALGLGFAAVAVLRRRG